MSLLIDVLVIDVLVIDVFLLIEPLCYENVATVRASELSRLNEKSMSRQKRREIVMNKYIGGLAPVVAGLRNG